jgi:hypothetical protein
MQGSPDVHDWPEIKTGALERRVFLNETVNDDFRVSVNFRGVL